MAKVGDVVLVQFGSDAPRAGIVTDAGDGSVLVDVFQGGGRLQGVVVGPDTADTVKIVSGEAAQAPAAQPASESTPVASEAPAAPGPDPRDAQIADVKAKLDAATSERDALKAELDAVKAALAPEAAGSGVAVNAENASAAAPVADPNAPQSPAGSVPV